MYDDRGADNLLDAYRQLLNDVVVDAA